MKKLLLASALTLSALSFAQVQWKSTRFGVTAGLNYSRVANAHNPSGPRYTFQGGALALIPVGKSNQFFIQPEVLYYGAGETGKDKDAKGKDGYDAVYANNYLSVPLYFKGYFSEAASEFFGLIGPRFNFLVNQNVKDAPVGRPYYDPDVTDPTQPSGVNGKAKNFNWGLALGVGYSYKRQLEVALKYDLGLSDTYPGLAKERGGTDKKKSEQVLALSLSYIFK
ncbi:PorT family protein [Chryseobacterium indologenes]|uniref:porin family protein n=1 Tax=Chryseobacterium indologenes TaxID=253 RepID=UPI000B5160B6|nr:porin family protein [Chryseobacterium indologenes]ASE62407.1 PorT family protein [Chryseobacterium indologenes]AYZ34668.1 PorT family protein [Chryseobacterium indologenes]MBF6643244.1 PorT family protein [Chryseobacterium indologenes]MBU3050535.1 PorT family protein [Chryseobacterium indologenes]MEB4758922.1 porin family protein [Chryseobacterium indologenes]